MSSLKSFLFQFTSEMACSKELRIPREWSKHHHDIVKESVDPELYSDQEVVDLCISIGLCDESTIKKATVSLRPYHFMRYMAVVVPNDPILKEMYKLWAHISLTTVYSDDIMETFGETEMRKICDAFVMMDKQICKQFPHFPTIAEMKLELTSKGVDEKCVPHVLNLLYFTNGAGEFLIRQGQFSQVDVRDFWRRFTVSIALYLECVKADTISIDVPNVEIVWRRALSGGVLPWLHYLEVSSGALGKLSGENLSLITELYNLNGCYCMTLNDVYSHEKEEKRGITGVNTVSTLSKSEECSSDTDAALKAIRIINASVKVMYQMIESGKQGDPDNKEFHKLLDYIGMATAGWYFFHEYSPRYQDVQWRVTLVDVEEEELKEWRESQIINEFDSLQHFLQQFSPKARKINDAVKSGVINMHANVLPA